MANLNYLLPPHLLEIGRQETGNYDLIPFLRSYHICARDGMTCSICIELQYFSVTLVHLPPFLLEDNLINDKKFRFTTYYSSPTSHPRNKTLR